MESNKFLYACTLGGEGVLDGDAKRILLMLLFKILGILSAAIVFCCFFCTVMRVCLMR